MGCIFTNDILINILSVLVTVIVIPIISIFGAKIVKLINAKINNSFTLRILTEATNIVTNAVRTVCQTYVDELKSNGTFNEAAQKEAFNKAKAMALEQMNEQIKDYIMNNYNDIDTWLNNQIEASVQLIKNKNE